MKHSIFDKVMLSAIAVIAFMVIGFITYVGGFLQGAIAFGVLATLGAANLPEKRSKSS